MEIINGLLSSFNYIYQSFSSVIAKKKHWTLKQKQCTTRREREKKTNLMGRKKKTIIYNHVNDKTTIHKATQRKAEKAIYTDAYFEQS